MFSEYGTLHKGLHRLIGPENARLAREYMRARGGRERGAITQMQTTGALLVHVPKTAGKAVGAALGLWTNHRPARFFLWSDPEGFARARKAAVVRDPFDRLVSNFFYFRQFSEPRPQSRAVRDVLNGFDDFQSFCRALEDPALQRFLSLQEHFLPQCYFVCDHRDRVIVDRIFRFETLQEDFPEICRFFGREGQLQKQNASERAPVSAYLSPEACARVETLYARDYAAFGYPLPSERLGQAEDSSGTGSGDSSGTSP